MSLFGNQRQDTREVFFRAYEKLQRNESLEGVETIVGQVIRAHPEYHPLLRQRETFADHDYLPEHGETNPFLHMGMHVAIEEQLSLDRPQGIRAAYQALLLRLTDPHAAQHQVMECLGEMIWQAQRMNTAPDEIRYLECLKNRN